jgi:hypothetical protein
VFERKRQIADKFIVLASDGVFDFMSNADVVNFFSERLYPTSRADGEGEREGGDSARGSRNGFDYTGRSDDVCGDMPVTPSRPPPISAERFRVLAALACDQILQECLKRGATDNMSVVLIILGASAQVGGSDVEAEENAIWAEGRMAAAAAATAVDAYAPTAATDAATAAAAAAMDGTSAVPREALPRIAACEVEGDAHAAIAGDVDALTSGISKRLHFN